MEGLRFQRLAGLYAILVGVGGFLYSVAFVVIERSSHRLGAGLAGFFLLFGGVLVPVVLLALYERLEPVDRHFARWAVILGLAGALGSAIHGGFDLANAINPPGLAGGTGTAPPNPVDPRGLLTFGFAGLALFLIAWLMRKSGAWPPFLVYLGFASGTLLVIIYLARLTILNAANPALLVPAALEGFVVNPIWYVWLGLRLRRGPPQG